MTTGGRNSPNQLIPDNPTVLADPIDASRSTINGLQVGIEWYCRYRRVTAKRRAALVLSILKGETSAAEAARKHVLTVGQVEEWREVFLLGAENAPRSRPHDEEALKDEQIRRLKQKVGELGLDLDIMQEAIKGRPFARTTSDE